MATLRELLKEVREKDTDIVYITSYVKNINRNVYSGGLSLTDIRVVKDIIDAMLATDKENTDGKLIGMYLYDESNEKFFIDISLFKNGEQYGIETMYWEDLIDVEVDDKMIRKVGLLPMLSEIITGMTFFGKDAKEVRTEVDEIHKALEESLHEIREKDHESFAKIIKEAREYVESIDDRRHQYIELIMMMNQEIKKDNLELVK